MCAYVHVCHACVRVRECICVRVSVCMCACVCWGFNSQVAWEHAEGEMSLLHDVKGSGPGLGKVHLSHHQECACSFHKEFLSPSEGQTCAVAGEAKMKKIQEFSLVLMKDLRGSHEGYSVVWTPGAVGLDIREDRPLGWAGRRSTFCPVEKEEGLCRQREQQVQRGSVKGPGMSGGGEKLRDEKARTPVCACVRACWGTTRGRNGERQGMRPKSEPLLFSLKR